MARFLVTYWGEGMPADPKVMEASKAAFGAWLARAGDAVVDPGAPVGAGKAVTSGGIADRAIQSELRGWTLLEAADLDAAAALLADHPFVARGGTLQVQQAIAI